MTHDWAFGVLGPLLREEEEEEEEDLFVFNDTIVIHNKHTLQRDPGRLRLSQEEEEEEEDL